MSSILWIIFSWIMKGIVILMMLTMIAFFCKFVWTMVTNGGRKWYYYDASKPWKGGYWTPLLPSAPPYNEYEWNPKTCRFEHKETGRTAVLMAEAGKKTKGQETTYQEEVPRMVEILV